ncbi:hypothetical protein [Paramagnetospirillum kuznetsovii]|uniref:hypothetical protein n=1 Tax=Paramagnetospirillum kuznetsovii TaxID=2053833 RepID=UPI0011BFA401|nr:hypothetical protein [Paramagnetospirillum kuznetsovii]
MTKSSYGIVESFLHSHAEYIQTLVCIVSADKLNNDIVDKIRDHKICQIGIWISTLADRYGVDENYIALDSAHKSFHNDTANIFADLNSENKEKIISTLTNINSMAGGAFHGILTPLTLFLLQTTNEENGRF